MNQQIIAQLISQLPAIIFALAALLGSLATVIQILKTHTKIDAIGASNNLQLKDIAGKVDGGLTKMMEALSKIAVSSTANIANTPTVTEKTVLIKEGQRSTDKTLDKS